MTCNLMKHIRHKSFSRFALHNTELTVVIPSIEIRPKNREVDYAS